MDRAALEFQAAQALMAARLMEDALYATGTWTMRWGPFEVPAERVVSEDGVVFSSTFPEMCWIEPPECGVVLLLDGEVRGIRRIDHPGDSMFVVTWDVILSTPESVS